MPDAAGNQLPDDQPGKARQFASRLVEHRRRLLALGEVADEAGEIDAVAAAHFAHGELHGEGRAVLAPADHDAVDAETPAAPEAQPQIAAASLVQISAKPVDAVPQPATQVADARPL